MTTSPVFAAGWNSGSAFRPGLVGKVAIVGAVVAGAAIVEAALLPGLLIGGAAVVLAPRLLQRHRSSTEPKKVRRTVATPAPVRPAPSAPGAEATPSSEAASFDTWRAIVKTLTFRTMVTTVDFGANYFVIGELATAAGLSSLSLVAGPIAYFAHEAAWHYYGPISARHANPLKAAVHLPIPGAAEAGQEGAPRPGGLKVSRALAKTVTYEAVTGVSEFSVNYLFVRDLAAAAGLTAFSVIVAPIVYYVHEKAWDYYDAARAHSRSSQMMKLPPGGSGLR